MHHQLLPSLFAEQLEHRYPQRGRADHVAIDSVSLAILPGHIGVIEGPSGSGKSTLLMILAGMLRPTRGRVETLGTNPYQLTADKRSQFRRQHLGVVLPMFGLLPYLSASANLRLVVNGPGRQERVDELLEKVGMANQADRLTDRLSTGERRRLLIARSLAHRPRLLLIDEPTANLDRENADRIRDIIVTYVQQANRSSDPMGTAALIVTHERADFFQATRVFTMRAGRLEPTNSGL